MDDKKMTWWREARFGMFIHWGLYSLLGGFYDNEEVPGAGEWIMHNARIPLSDYKKIAESFNPVDFNAEEICRLAHDAGMKYIVYTAKHHDGFAMYQSSIDKYNIVDATPYKRDPLRDLACECRKYGLKLCIYYSQTLDWSDSDALGNTWDFDGSGDFDRYLKRKCLPQLTELLTNYGEIGLIWFDLPNGMTKEQSKVIADHVRSIQPQCILSGRIGNGLSDYKSSGDNSIPYLPVGYDWECPATLNHTWGFKVNDHDWKNPEDILHKLIDINGKNGNYLLNIGPDGKGKIPTESVEILRSIGNWMQHNSDSIYGTCAAPIPPYEQNELFTCKPGKLFIHFFGQNKNHITPGLYLIRNMDIDVRRCYFMDEPEKMLEWSMDFPQALGVHYFRIKMPENMTIDMDRVLCVEYNGTIVCESV